MEGRGFLESLPLGAYQFSLLNKHLFWPDSISFLKKIQYFHFFANYYAVFIDSTSRDSRGCSCRNIDLQALFRSYHNNIKAGNWSFFMSQNHLHSSLFWIPFIIFGRGQNNLLKMYRACPNLSIILVVGIQFGNKKHLANLTKLGKWCYLSYHYDIDLWSPLCFLWGLLPTRVVLFITTFSIFHPLESVMIWQIVSFAKL